MTGGEAARRRPGRRDVVSFWLNENQLGWQGMGGSASMAGSDGLMALPLRGCDRSKSKETLRQEEAAEAELTLPAVSR